MQIGLIGGIGPAATDYYYRQLIEIFAKAGVSLELTIVHADTATLLKNLTYDRKAEQAALFKHLADRLFLAGAGCVGVTSIAGHFCRREFELLSPLPVIDMIGSVAADITAHCFRRIGILGTRTVMESSFYGGITFTTILPPPEPQLTAVHNAYVAMAAAGKITAEQTSVFNAASRHLIDDEGVEAIMLGGTDLALAFDSNHSTFPLIDCAAIHARAIASYAMDVKEDG